MKYLISLCIFFSLPLLAESITVNAQDQQTLWIALFGLGLIGILAIFLSSEQMRNIKKEYSKLRQQQEESEKKQHDILFEMSQNIQNMAKEAIGETTQIVKNKHATGSQLSEVITTENNLLDITIDLIEFLKLKSNKIKVSNENFKLENLLNDILGQTNANYKGSNIELIFDVDDNIEDILHSDTLNIAIILVNLIDFCILNKAKKIVLQVSKRSRFNSPTTLHFILYTDMGIKIDNDIFNTTYNENTKKHDGIPLFISKELSILLGGNLIARNAKNSSPEFILTLPFVGVKPSVLKENKLDISELQTQKVYVVDSFHQSTLAIEKMLRSLKYDVDISTKNEYLKELPNFANYDMLILDERLITSKTVERITQLQNNSTIQVIILGNVFASAKNSQLKGLKLNKPLTKESLYYTLIDAQSTLLSSKKQTINTSNKSTLKVVKERFKDTQNINLTSFIDFKDTKLLIVEDNLINQKVLISMLKKSTMDIKVANDGKEALEILNSNCDCSMILMDINMPIMDGYEATLKIREDVRFNNIPIVALSALTSTDEINKVFYVGMNAYLAKPFSKEKLYTAFDTFLKKTTTTNTHKAEYNEIIVELDGLDIAKGLEQTNANSIFYIEVLKEFKEAYSQSDDVFESLMSEHRFEQIKMLCFDMRGLAGAIGANEMHDLSSEILQRILFRKYDLLPDYVKQYKETLTQLNVSIDKYIDINQ